MANQVIPRLKGDDYQHLYSWYLALELKLPYRQVKCVSIENVDAGSVDDVTIEYAPEANEPSRFYQLKYHVDQRKQYSTDVLMAHGKGKSSLLQKFWHSWKLLRNNGQNRVELQLRSNWTWDPNDGLLACLDDNGAIKPEFYQHDSYAAMRGKWLSHLATDLASLSDFAVCLRFKVGILGGDDLKECVVERMRNLGLKSDEAALVQATGVVREWIKTGKKQISLSALDEMTKQNDLLLPCEQEHFLTVHLNTIVREKHELEPDYTVDWREFFEGDAAARGRKLLAQYDWNKDLLPDLDALKASIGSSTTTRLIRVQGKARLSPWFAFGYTFRDVAGYTLEVDQNGAMWRTDAATSNDFRVVIDSLGEITDGEVVDGTGETVAVGLSITGSLADAVRDHLAEREEKIAALLLIRPERELGRDCIRNAGDLVALADAAKDIIRSFVRKWRATKLLLYYFGPLSGACFLAHRFNAVCREIQLMEDLQPGYAPSFLLE